LLNVLAYLTAVFQLHRLHIVRYHDCERLACKCVVTSYTVALLSRCAVGTDNYTKPHFEQSLCDPTAKVETPYVVKISVKPSAAVLLVG